MAFCDNATKKKRSVPNPKEKTAKISRYAQDKHKYLQENSCFKQL
jgi:hypothetical protein